MLCLYSSLTGSSVPDLIVSMSNQMWLHLQSDDTIGSQGFKAVYEGMSCYMCHVCNITFGNLRSFPPTLSDETGL